MVEGRGKKPINIRIDADLHDKMKHYCIDNRTTITKVVTKIFEEMTKEEGESGSDRREDGMD